ncbi:hypothetical protein ACO0SA_004222 [Hanseniaspora valbyensis]
MVFSVRDVVVMTTLSSTLISANSGVQFDLKKHFGSLNSKSIVSKDTNDILSFALLNEQSFFSVDLEIGTPLQDPVTLLVDTGSSDTWVNGAAACLPGTYSGNSSDSKKRDEKRYASSILEGFELTASYDSTYFNDVSTDFIAPSATVSEDDLSSTETSGVDCNEYGAFNTALSSTWKEIDLSEEFAIQYVDLTYAEGVYGSDTVHINGVSVPGTIFAVSTFSNSTQGVLGISLPRDESLYTNFENGSTYMNLPQQLKANGLISKVAYSFFLNSICDNAGAMLFGGIDTSWYTGELNTVPLVNIYSYFSDTPIEFDISVNGVGISDYPKLGDTKTLSTTIFPALLDSGTSLMQLPPNLAYALADSLDFVYDEDYGWFIGACPTELQSRESSIVFNIGGNNYYSPLNNFIFTTSSAEVCAFAADIYTSGGYYEDVNDYSVYNNYAILGDVVMTSLLVVYDLESYELTLGVANYEGFNDEESSNVEKIVSTVPGAKKAPLYSSTWSSWDYVSHFTGNETDGIFTNSDEVNPWIATSVFGCSFDYNFPQTSTTASNISSYTMTTPIASVESTTMVTITSCQNETCVLSASPAMVSVVTTTTNRSTYEYTTYYSFTTSLSKQDTTANSSTSANSTSSSFVSKSENVGVKQSTGSLFALIAGLLAAL